MIVSVNTIDETRRARLEMLIKQHGGKLANLNEALGLERTHSQLSRIRNRNARKDRPGKFFEMGDDQAREIEIKLGLPTGWMDTPPTYAELHGESDLLTEAFKAMEKMPAFLQKVASDVIFNLAMTRVPGAMKLLELTTKKIDLTDPEELRKICEAMDEHNASLANSKPETTTASKLGRRKDDELGAFQK